MLEANRLQGEDSKRLSFPHVRALDGLRAIAVAIVFIGHAKIFQAFPAGFGVTIFFFLSGFLITSLLRVEYANNKNVNLRAFYIRRILRINPPLWISMVFMALMVAFGFLKVELLWKDIVSQAFFFANYMPGHAQGGGLPSPLWSLAVEEHFYLIFPVIFIFLSGKIEARTMAAILLVACLLIMALRLYNVLALNIVEENYYWSHTRIDSIVFGSILALFSNPLIDDRRDGFSPNHYHFFAALAITCVTFVIKLEWFEYGLKYTIQGMALFVIFSYILQNKNIITKPLHFSFVQIIGLYSYSIYLIHYAFILAVQQAVPEANVLVQAAVSGSLSVGFAYAMYRLVERPLARVRKRYV